LAEYEKSLDANSIFPADDCIPSFSSAKVSQNNPLGPCSTSEIYNAPIMSTPKVGSLSESIQRYETENQMYICSPIQERDNESQPEHYTPTAANPNYVTPTATGKNSRRLNAIGTNAPHQLHHESRLGGISPNPKGSQVDSS